MPIYQTLVLQSKYYHGNKIVHPCICFFIFRGYEERLEDCHHDPWAFHYCEHNVDATVACSKSTPVQTGLAVLSKKLFINQIFPRTGYRDELSFFDMGKYNIYMCVYVYTYTVWFSYRKATCYGSWLPNIVGVNIYIYIYIYIYIHIHI